MNKKGFATSTIVFTLLSVFLISISILLVTITNTNKTKNTLNEKVVNNIEYGSNSYNELEQRLEELENKTDTILDKMYPIGSLYMSTTDDTIEKVQNRFGGTWEKYSEGRTIIGDGTTTDKKGNALVYTNGQTGGNSTQTLTISNLPNHNHIIPSLSVSSWSGSHSHNAVQNNTNASFFIMGSSSGETIAGYADGSSFYGVNKSRKNSTASTTITVSGQKTTASSTTQCTNCTSTSFSVQDPYIVTYIYKRVK